MDSFEIILAKDTDETLRKISIFLKQRGWAYKGTTKQSAMFESNWKLGDWTITINGWHGQGVGSRNYGDIRLIFDVFLIRGYKTIDLWQHQNLASLPERVTMGSLPTFKYLNTMAFQKVKEFEVQVPR